MNGAHGPLSLDHALRSRIADRLGGFERRRVEDHDLRRAAVAIAIVDDTESHPAFLLTRRSERLKNHGGQWALPGGRLDPDETARQAALRELDEELAVGLGEDQVLGLLDDYPTRSGFVITPVVVWGGAGVRCEPNPAEVAEVHRVALGELMKPEVPHLRSIPESDRPVISIPIVGTQVHAPTAAILFQLREVALLGRSTRVHHYEQPVFAWK